MPISHPLLLLGLLSASAAVRVLFWEENLSVFLFPVFRFPLDWLLPPFESGWGKEGVRGS